MLEQGEEDGGARGREVGREGRSLPSTRAPKRSRGALGHPSLPPPLPRALCLAWPTCLCLAFATLDGPSPSFCSSPSKISGLYSKVGGGPGAAWLKQQS